MAGPLDAKFQFFGVWIVL